MSELETEVQVQVPEVKLRVESGKNIKMEMVCHQPSLAKNVLSCLISVIIGSSNLALRNVILRLYLSLERKSS